MEGLLVFAIIGLLVVAGIGFAVWSEKKRTEGLEMAATQLGLEFRKQGDDPQLQDRLAGFLLFQQGRGRKIQNLILGEAGEIRISIFDYQYTTGSGKQQQTSRQTVIFLESAQLQIPAFTLRPESFFDRIGGALGLQKDIDFDEYPVFSKQYLLKSDNEPAVRKLFHADLVRKLEASKSICIEAGNGSFVVYVARQRKKPEQLKAQFAEALEYFNLLVSPEAAKS